MEKDELIDRKKNGVYYTPDELALKLAEPLISGGNISVFDPSYGKGSLLLAAERIFQKFNIDHSIKLYGSDINPVNGLLKHLPEANLVEQNFFDYTDKTKHDVILTNPPYIKHQDIDKVWLSETKKNDVEFAKLKNSSDLWAYFLLKSLDHLKVNGSIGAILPWSFLQSNYAITVRRILLSKFCEIRVQALDKIYFDNTNERVVLVWLKGFGGNTEKVYFQNQKKFTLNQNYIELNKDEWTSEKVIDNSKNHLKEITEYFQKNKNFKPLSQIADVRIGIVTGANKFFVKEKPFGENLGIDRKNLVPVICKSKDLREYLAEGKERLKELLILDNQTDYIGIGESYKFNERTHSKNRNPWYKVNPGKIPDAFFPYRVGKIPYLVLNEHSVQSLNSVHRLYFKNINKNERKWVLLTLLSIYGQLFINNHCKDYGRKMIKMEPGSLYQVLVNTSGNKVNDSAYKEILYLLINHEKEQAVLRATDMVNKEFGISKKIEKYALKAWENLTDLY